MYRDFDIKPVSPISLPTKVIVKDKVYLFSGNQQTTSGRPDMVMILRVNDSGKLKWEFELASGLERPPLNTMGMSGCYDGNDTVYLFGGFSVPPKRNLTQHYDSDLKYVSKGKKEWKVKNYNTLYKYSVKSNAFEEVKVPEDHQSVSSVPCGRYGASLLYSSDTFGIYLFGGASGDGLRVEVLHHDLWKFDLVTSSWERLSCARTPSPTLAFHTADITPDGKRMVIFGGLTYSGTGTMSPNMACERPSGKFGSLGLFKGGKPPKIVVSNQLWICYLENLTWRRVKVVSGAKPTRRFLHDSLMIGSKMLYAFGSSKYEPGKLEKEKGGKKSKKTSSTTSTSPHQEAEEAEEEGKEEEEDHPSGPPKKESGLNFGVFPYDMDWKSEMRKVFSEPKRSVYMFDFDENRWYRIHKIRKKPQKKKKKKKQKNRRSRNNNKLQDDEEEREEESQLVEEEVIRLVNYSTRISCFPNTSTEYGRHLIIFGDLNRRSFGLNIQHKKFLELLRETMSITTTTTSTSNQKRTYSPPVIPHRRRRSKKKKGEEKLVEEEEEEEEEGEMKDVDSLVLCSTMEDHDDNIKRLKKKKKKKKKKMKMKPSVSSFVVLADQDDSPKKTKKKMNEQIGGIKKNIFTKIE